MRCTGKSPADALGSLVLDSDFKMDIKVWDWDPFDRLVELPDSGNIIVWHMYSESDRAWRAMSCGKVCAGSTWREAIGGLLLVHEDLFGLDVICGTSGCKFGMPGWYGEFVDAGHFLSGPVGRMPLCDALRVISESLHDRRRGRRHLGDLIMAISRVQARTFSEDKIDANSNRKN